MSQLSPDAAPAARPTRVRYGVLGFACTLSMITYLDRVCFSSGQSALIDSLGLHNESDLKWAFTAFALAYSLFEVPSGWLGDVFGPRNVLLRIVLWWSAFTAITGLVGYWAWNGWTFSLPVPWSRPITLTFGWMAVLVLVRFVFGLGEAGAYPNITRALHNWFPMDERAFTQGCVWMSGRLMGGLTPIIWAVLVEGLGRTVTTAEGQQAYQVWIHPLLPGWRWSFWFFGAIGAIWCVLFARWFRNRPEEKPSVNAAELALIRAGGAESQTAHKGIPWGRMLRSRNLWALCFMYACQAYGWYFYITYLPRCLESQYGVAKTDMLGAIYKGGPLWMGAVGCLTGGFLSDWFIRRTGNRRLGRKLFGVIAHAFSAVCFLLAPLAPTAFWFFVVMASAGFFTDLAMGPAWAICQDVGRRYAAIVAGMMNMIGNLGGTLASWMSGYVLARALAGHAAGLGATVEELSQVEKTAGLLQGYHLNFYIFACVYLVGVVCWLLIDATRPVAPEES